MLEYSYLLTPDTILASCWLFTFSDVDIPPSRYCSYYIIIPKVWKGYDIIIPKVWNWPLLNSSPFPLCHRYFMLHLSVVVKIVYDTKKYNTSLYADEPLKNPLSMKSKYKKKSFWSFELEFANFSKLDNKSRCFTNNNHFDVNRIKIDILLRSFRFGFW